MDYVKIKCKKCGYELEMPEKTGSVICGSCGKVNSFTKISSFLNIKSDYPAQNSSIKTDIKTIPGRETSNIKQTAYKSIPETTQFPEKNETPVEEEQIEFPEQKTASKIMTLVFILAPFIAMAVEFFKLPPYAAIGIILLIVLIGLFIKKRS